MTIPSGRRFLFIGVLAAVLLVGLHQLLWGKLFPYSPVRPGFARYEFAHVIVYLQEGSPYTRYHEIDALIPNVEKNHALCFKRKPEVLVFCDSASYLQRSMTKARYYAYPNGSLVVSPWAVREASEGKISMDVYLTHELSHTLLYQQMGFVNAYFCFPRWLLEGIAVYNSHQMGTSWYPDKSETYAYIRQGNFVPPEWFGTRKEQEVPLNVKYNSTFAYCEFACLVDYLIERYGKEKFVRYLSGLLESWQHDGVFKEVYEIEFDVFVDDFKNHVRQ